MESSLKKSLRTALSVATLAGCAVLASALPANAGTVNNILQAPNSAEHCVGFDNSNSTDPKLNENNFTGTTYYPDLYVGSTADCTHPHG